MREIKFRAWLKDHMLYQSDNTASAMNGLDRFAVLVGSEKGYTPEVMQYTGLKDKNGVEICEGDIVRFKNEYMESEVAVKWRPKSAGWNLDNRYLANTEVIGNIYENPELMEAAA